MSPAAVVQSKLATRILEFLENRPAEEQRRLNVLKTALADGEKSTVATRESRNAAALRKCSPDVHFLA